MHGQALLQISGQLGVAEETEGRRITCCGTDRVSSLNNTTFPAVEFCIYTLHILIYTNVKAICSTQCVWYIVPCIHTLNKTFLDSGSIEIALSSMCVWLFNM